MFWENQRADSSNHPSYSILQTIFRDWHFGEGKMGPANDATIIIMTAPPAERPPRPMPPAWIGDAGSSTGHKLISR